MYKYPANLREKAKMGLWTLGDVVAITILALISIMLLTRLNFLIPLVGTAVYMLLSANVNDTSIKEYLIYIFRYCASGVQYYIWGL